MSKHCEDNIGRFESTCCSQAITATLRSMYRISPPESVHSLDLVGLKSPNIKFWCAWQCSQLLGCGALTLRQDNQGEIKSIRTDNQHRRKAVAAAILQHIIKFSHDNNAVRLSIETGSHPFF